MYMLVRVMDSWFKSAGGNAVVATCWDQASLVAI